MNLNCVGLSLGLSLAGLGANLTGVAGMGARRQSTHDVHPLQMTLQNISSSNPTWQRNHVYKNAFILAYSVI